MAMNMEQSTDHQETAEQILWRAVIASTVEEWMHGQLRRKREAEEFLFQNDKDYNIVCVSAGIDPQNLRERLRKIRASAGGKNSQN
jgi:hypothetical protein